MDIFTMILVVIGLAVFESINSIDNAVINAEVLDTVGPKARKWFLTWGIFFAVFVVRGLLPFIIVWSAIPALGPIGALTATFSSDPKIIGAIEAAAPVLLLGAGVFLLFLFLHWIFLETKRFGLKIEKFFYENGLWFYASTSLLLVLITWEALKVNPLLAFGATIGAAGFFITHGFKENAERAEIELKTVKRSDMSKLLYLEMIDMAFSIDGVLGAFAFTFAIPLILVGNGLGALVVRQITLSNIEHIKKYVFLKHGAMYSVLALGVVMILEGFGLHVPSYVSPLLTFATIGYFFVMSKKDIAQSLA